MRATKPMPAKRFSEFRLDHLNAPEQGIAVIRKFLAGHPDCRILATCRRHQNHGKLTAVWKNKFACSARQ